MNKHEMIIENNTIYVLRLFAGQSSNIFLNLDLSLVADNKKILKNSQNTLFRQEFS